jgi:hypothetical protein
MRGVGKLRRRVRTLIVLACSGLWGAGCSLSEGPPRLFTVAEETQFIRESITPMTPGQFSALDESTRFKYRNDWIAARMYAIDIQYTTYEAELTTERQAVGFGASAATLGLTTASGLLTPVVTKNVLTGLAGVATGTRAAYDNDVLLAHSVQWIQTQMRTQRSFVAERIFRAMKASTVDYPLAAALTDLEDYYRAGTLTGGVLGTSATLGEQAQLAETLKQDRIEVSFVSTAAGRALRSCLLRPPAGVTQKDQRARLVGLMATPNDRGFALLLTGQSPAVAEDLLRRATVAGFCL